MGPSKVNLTADNLPVDQMVKGNLQNAYAAGNTSIRNAGTLIRMPKVDLMITNLILKSFAEQ
jgi:hypothetical protein